MASINDFKAALTKGGARANQFRVSVALPTNMNLSSGAFFEEDFLLCKAASLPASNLENIPVMYRGRPANFAGERTFEPWSATFYNTFDAGTPGSLKLRAMFEEWHSIIQNTTKSGGQLNDYWGTVSVEQTDRNDQDNYRYIMYNAYPLTVSAIELDYDNGTAIETFEVTFQYDYYISDGVAGNSDAEDLTEFA